MSKTNTIPTEHMQGATLSAWLNRYPFMQNKPRLWGLHKTPVGNRCKALYPAIVRALHGDMDMQHLEILARPLVVNFSPSLAKAS